jgi:RNA polymerase sigma factor (sigma-70 family)
MRMIDVAEINPPIFWRNDEVRCRGFCIFPFGCSVYKKLLGCMYAKGRLKLSWDVQELFRRHAKGMARFLHRRGINKETAVDLTQDTFLRVIATPPRDGMQNHNPKAYLYQAARNLSINHQKREALIEITSLDDEEAVKLADPAPSAERIVYSKQCLVQTHQALSELPERTRLAFEMHRLGERTIAEIGEELGISTTRAWTLIRDAYRHLVGRVDLF